MIKILILAGRLDADDAGWPLTPLLDRLERRGLQLQVLCLSKGIVAMADTRAVDVPALGNRWLRALAARRLWSEGLLQRPHMMHVVDDEMVEVALALSENNQIPYVQTVAGFGSVERGLRLSRRWCRSPGGDQSRSRRGHDDRDWGFPTDRITIIPPGIVAHQESFDAAGTWKVPVIGAGGPLEEASGSMIFLDAARLVLEKGYDIEFVIATHGGEQSQLRQSAQQLNIGEHVTVSDYSILGAKYLECAGHLLPTRHRRQCGPCAGQGARARRPLHRHQRPRTPGS